MTSDEINLVYKATESIKHAERFLQLVKSSPLPKEEAAARAFSTFQRIATKSLGELRELWCAVDAHSTSGMPFPKTVIEFVDSLDEYPQEWLSYINRDQAEKWRVLVRKVVSTVKGYPGSQLVFHLYTPKTESDLRRIYSDLVEAGFIAGEDPVTHAGLLNSFLNVFAQDSLQQGHIIWRATSKKWGSHGTPSPTAAIDFVATIGEIDKQQVRSILTQEWGNTIFPTIFPELVCSKSTRTSFINLWECGDGSCWHSELRKIICG